MLPQYFPPCDLCTVSCELALGGAHLLSKIENNTSFFKFPLLLLRLGIFHTFIRHSHFCICNFLVHSYCPFAHCSFCLFLINCRTCLCVMDL